METTIHKVRYRGSMSSYRTYEEWKHNSGAGYQVGTGTGSYRTYEEWKRFTLPVFCHRPIGSYRTYEEWKLILYYNNIAIIQVLTVPMRNGNVHLAVVFLPRIEFLPYL